MSDITEELQTIATAVYGRDMRSAIHDGLEKVSDDVDANAEDIADIQEQLDEVFQIYEEIDISQARTGYKYIFNNGVLASASDNSYTAGVYYGEIFTDTLYVSCVVTNTAVPVVVVANNVGATVSESIAVYAEHTGTFDKTITFDMSSFTSGANIYINNASSSTPATLYTKVTGLDVYTKEQTDEAISTAIDTAIGNALNTSY